MLDNEIRNKINRYLIEKTDFIRKKDKLNEDELRAFVDKAISTMCMEERIELQTEDRITLIRELASAVVSLGPIRQLMEDPTISEIMVNGSDRIYIQRDGKIELTDVKFLNNSHLQHTVQKILASSGTSRRVDESSPYVDFSLPDGSRVNVILSPCSLVGPVITIRKFNKEINTVDDLLKLKMFDNQMAVLLTASMKAKLNIVFCGATGTGKTTTLNVLSKHIPIHERIITIEDTPELRLLQDHVVSLQSKAANIEGKGEITIRDLFINSLRMRPDRIIIGEVRGSEMLDLIQSIASGHSGSLAIIHAESPEDCFDRMVTMMLLTGIRLSTDTIEKQVARAIDMVMFCELYSDGVRRITNVTDVIWDDKEGKVILEDVFRFEQDKIDDNGQIFGKWWKTKKVPSFYTKFEKHFVKLPENYFS